MTWRWYLSITALVLKPDNLRETKVFFLGVLVEIMMFDGGDSGA